MIGTQMIPNPTKTFTINAPIDKAMDIFNNFTPLVNSIKKGYTLSDKDELMNSFTFDKSEFLSLGVHIEVNLKENGQKTDVEIEVKRKLGAFDSWVEVQLAGEHIKNFSKAISMGLDPEKLQKSKNKMETVKTPTPPQEVKEVSTLTLVMFALIGFVFLMAVI